MIRLITIDLDGTLFDSDSKISNDNKRAISKCINSGIKIVISTGKSIKCVDSVIKELGLVDLQIVSGGTIIITPDLKIQTVMKILRNSVFNAINLARDSGIDKNEVMAIGDSNNDLGTVKFAGVGIAMGNATRDVKLAADHISSDNNSSGVAEAIYKFIKF